MRNGSSSKKLSSPDRSVQYKKKELKRVKNYVLGCRLGKGSYGTVKEALDVESKKRVAIKICKEHCLRRIPGGLGHVEEEIKILESLDHPNVIKMLTHWKEDEKMYIVLEYIGGGSLTSFLNNQDGKKVTSAQARGIFKGLIHGLEYLHERGIVHGDIKPDNLLLTSDGSLKITDFGVSMITERLLEQEEESSEESNFAQALCGRGQGTVAFQPPEVVSGKVKFAACGSRLDVWASGIVLYIMTVGDYPFQASGSVNSLLDSISSAECEFPDDIEPELQDLLELMLQKEDEKHITIPQIKEHSWFNKSTEEVEVDTLPTYFERKRLGGYRVSSTFGPVKKENQVTCMIL